MTQPLREPARLPREFDGVLVRIGTGQGKKDPASLETRLLQQDLREFGARLRTPGGSNKT